MSKDLSTNLLYSLKKIALFKYKKRIFKNYFFIRKKKDHDLLLVLEKNFLKLSYNINHKSLNFFLGKSKIDFNLALKYYLNAMNIQEVIYLNKCPLSFWFAREYRLIELYYRLGLISF